MNKITNCTKCELHKNGKLVWGRGNENADIFFIGEAPGKEESESGLPFVGKCGRFLSSLLEDCKIKEKDVYISNIVKHRPLNNRNPLIHEIRACQQFLINELRFVNPKLIVTLGKVPGNWFNHYKDFKIGTYYNNKRWLPLYHPSFLMQWGKKFIPEWKKSLIETIRGILNNNVFI